MKRDVFFSSWRKNKKRKTIRIMLEKTKKTLIEEIGNSSNLTCDPIPVPVVGIVKTANALKEDIKKK